MMCPICYSSCGPAVEPILVSMCLSALINRVTVFLDGDRYSLREPGRVGTLLICSSFPVRQYRKSLASRYDMEGFRPSGSSKKYIVYVHSNKQQEPWQYSQPKRELRSRTVPWLDGLKLASASERNSGDWSQLSRRWLRMAILRT